jgi:hypothetical protein
LTPWTEEDPVLTNGSGEAIKLTKEQSRIVIASSSTGNEPNRTNPFQGFQAFEILKLYDFTLGP